MIKQNFSLALKAIRKHKLKSVIVMFSDLNFVFFFIVAFSYVFSNYIVDILINIDNLVKQQTANIGTSIEEQTQVYQSLYSNLDLTLLMNEMKYWIAVLGISLFLIWLIFQALSFTLSATMVGKKISAKKYLVRFAFFSTFFSIIVASAFVSTVYLAGINEFLPLPFFGPSIINLFLLLFLFVVLYFWMISLSSVMHNSIKKTFHFVFVKSFKNSLQLLLTYLIGTCILFFVFLLMVFSLSISIFLFFAVVFLLLLLMLINRLFLLVSISQIIQQKTSHHHLVRRQ